MNITSNRRAVLALGITTAALTLGLSGCSSASDATPVESSAPATGYPLTIDNCGTEVTVTSAPQQIVTIKSSATELLLALGLAERIVGAAALDGPIPDDLDDPATPLSIISDSVPGQEATLALEPDFIYGGWESNFSDDGVGDREQLATFGVGSYVSPSACKEEGYQPDPLTFDTVFDEILQAGQIFDAQAAAEELVATQRAELDALEPSEDGLTALWYSSGSDTPYVGAGIGSANMIMDAAGLSNIVGDVHDTWSSVSWEAIAAENPDVIVLVDSAWGSAEKKIGVLEANPATAQLDAVRNGRYIVLPFAATEAGTRNVEATASIIAQLGELSF